MFVAYMRLPRGYLEKWDAEKHPRHPAGASDGLGGQFAPAGETGTVFVSPNLDTLTTKDALGRMDGGRHGRLKSIFKDQDKAFGVAAAYTSGIGAYTGGGEDTMMVAFTGNLEADDLRAWAAAKGLVADQLTTLLFRNEENGPHHFLTYSFEGKPEEISEKLLNAGVPFFTLLPRANGRADVVYINDPGNDYLNDGAKHLASAAESMGADFLPVRRGTMQMIGAGFTAEGEWSDRGGKSGFDENRRGVGKQAYKSILASAARRNTLPEEGRRLARRLSGPGYQGA